MTQSETAVMPFNEIARRMGISRRAVMQAHDSALEKLERILSERGVLDRPVGGRQCR